MKISIIGLGWFGKVLAKELSGTHEIKGSTRSQLKVSALADEQITAEALSPLDRPSQDLLNADVIVLNIPPFNEQLAWFQSWNWNKKTHVIFISSTSIYGEVSGEVDENTVPIPDTPNGKILAQEEAWVRSFPLWTIIRFGGLIGRDRHPGKILSGRQNLGGANQPVNLIHLDDCVGFTKLVIEKKITNETFNLVNPDHPTRKDYYQGYCLREELSLPHFNLDNMEGKIVSSEKVNSLYSFKTSL